MNIDGDVRQTQMNCYSWDIRKHLLFVYIIDHFLCCWCRRADKVVPSHSSADAVACQIPPCAANVSDPFELYTGLTAWVAPVNAQAETKCVKPNDHGRLSNVSKEQVRQNARNLKRKVWASGTASRAVAECPSDPLWTFYLCESLTLCFSGSSTTCA